MKVLAIDDDWMILKAVEKLFPGAITTKRLRQGKEFAASEQPDVILIDATVQAPDDGIAALPELWLRSPHSCLIVITSIRDPSIKRRAKAAGAHSCVDKLNIGRLREIVKDVLTSVERSSRRDHLH